MPLKYYPVDYLIRKIKASAYKAGDPGSITGSGRSPGEGNGNPLQYSCLEIPMDGGAWLQSMGLQRVRHNQIFIPSQHLNTYGTLVCFIKLRASVLLPMNGNNNSCFMEQLCGSDSKASAHNVEVPGLIPGLGRSLGEGNGNPLQYSCLENSMDGGAWWATVHGVAKSWT